MSSHNQTNRIQYSSWLHVRNPCKSDSVSTKSPAYLTGTGLTLQHQEACLCSSFAHRTALQSWQGSLGPKQSAFAHVWLFCWSDLSSSPCQAVCTPVNIAQHELCELSATQQASRLHAGQDHTTLRCNMWVLASKQKQSKCAVHPDNHQPFELPQDMLFVRKLFVGIIFVHKPSNTCDVFTLRTAVTRAPLQNHSRS